MQQYIIKICALVFAVFGVYALAEYEIQLYPDKSIQFSQVIYLVGISKAFLLVAGAFLREKKEEKGEIAFKLSVSITVMLCVYFIILCVYGKLSLYQLLIFEIGNICTVFVEWTVAAFLSKDRHPLEDTIDKLNETITALKDEAKRINLSLTGELNKISAKLKHIGEERNALAQQLQTKGAELNGLATKMRQSESRLLELEGHAKLVSSLQQMGLFSLDGKKATVCPHCKQLAKAKSNRAKSISHCGRVVWNEKLITLNNN